MKLNPLLKSKTNQVYSIWVGVFFCLIFLIAGCNPRGIPGAAILTPGGLREAVVTASPEPTYTPEPTLTATEIPSIPTLPTETSMPEDTLTPTLAILPTETLTPTNTPYGWRTPTSTRTATFTRTPTRTRTTTFTRTPTRTRTITRTPQPTFTPTITFTPEPPAAFLQLQRPGPLSRVTSPIEIRAAITPGDDGMLYIDLFGEDGRLIAAQVLNYRAFIGRRAQITADLPFEIPGAAETSRLVLSVRDANGREIAVTALDLVLLQMGDVEINPPAYLQEPFLIRFPRANETISGGVFTVQALARPVNNSPLILELINDTGTVLASRLVQVAPPQGDLSHTPFIVQIPYTISDPVGVRLVIRQNSISRLPGTVALASRLYQLQP